MVCDVILTKSNNKFVARAKEWPEVVVEEDTREKVIDRLKSRLADYLTNQVEVIQVEIPLPDTTGNPWLDKFGWFKDDPTFDDLHHAHYPTITLTSFFGTTITRRTVLPSTYRVIFSSANAISSNRALSLPASTVKTVRSFPFTCTGT